MWLSDNQYFRGVLSLSDDQYLRLLVLGAKNPSITEIGTVIYDPPVRVG